MAASESVVLLNISHNEKHHIIEINRSDCVRDNRENVEHYWSIPSITICSDTARERNSFKNSNAAVAKSTDFVCSYCPYHHKLQSKLILHVGSHFALEASADALVGAVMKYDEAGKKFICSRCPRSTPDWTCFREHMRHHLYRLPYCCNVCLQPLSSVMQARIHFKTHSHGDLAFSNNCSTGILNKLMQLLHPRTPPIPECLKLFIVDDSALRRSGNCHEKPAYVRNVTEKISVPTKKSITAKASSKNYHHMYKFENNVFICKRCCYKTRISDAFRAHVSQDIHNAWAIDADDSSVGELPVSSTTESVVCGLMEILSHIALSGNTKDSSQPIGSCTQQESTVKSRLQQSVQDVFALGHPSDERKLQKNPKIDKTLRIGPELQLVRTNRLDDMQSSRQSQQACLNSLEVSIESSIKSVNVPSVALPPDTCTASKAHSADINPLSPVSTKPDFSDMYVLIPDRSPLPQKCELCSFTCSSPEQLNFHKSKAHCNRNKATDFSCPECPQKTNKLHILLWHLAHHPGEHTIHYYLCEVCNYSSMQKTDITKHEQAYHAGNEEKTVVKTVVVSYRHNLPQCPICSQSLLWKNIFINHLRDTHKLPELSNYLDAKYTSQDCPEKLEFPRSLLVSISCTDGGSNDVPNSEPECNKAVTICRFHCDHCNFSTDEKDSFSTHQMMHKDAVVTMPASLPEPALDGSTTNCKRKHDNKRQMVTGTKKLSNASVSEKFNQKAKPKTSVSSFEATVWEQRHSSTKVLTKNPITSFMESLPRKQVFAADVKCPLCSFSTRVRHNMLRHIQFQKHDDESSMVENQAPSNGLSFGLWLPEAVSNKSSDVPVGETVTSIRESQSVARNSLVAGSNGSKQCSERSAKIVDSANTGESGVSDDGAELEKLSSAPPRSCRFKCETCQMEYSFETDLEKHIADQHQGPYVCNVCDVQLWQKGKMYRHYTVEHPSAPIVLQVLSKDDVRQKGQCSSGSQVKMARTSVKQPSVSQSADVPAVSQMSTVGAESASAMVHSAMDPTKRFVRQPSLVNPGPSAAVATCPSTDSVTGGTRTLSALAQEETAVTISETQQLDYHSEPDGTRRSNLAAVTTANVGSETVSTQFLNAQSPDFPRPDVTKTLLSMLPAAYNSSLTASSVDSVLPAVAAGLVPILTDVMLKIPEITPGLVSFMTQLSQQQQHQQLAAALQTAQPLLSSLTGTLNTTVRAESTLGQARVDLPNDALLATDATSNDPAEAGGNSSELRSNAAAASHHPVGQRHHSMIELSDNVTDTCSRVRSLSPSEVSVTSTIASFLRAVSKSAQSGSSDRDSDGDSGVAPTRRKKRKIHKRALPSSLSSSRSSMSSPLKPSYILYSCNLCRFATRSLNQYGRHLHEEFATAKRRISARERCSADDDDDESVCLYCHYCSFRTFIRDEFDQHVATHTVPGKNVKCVYCSFASSTTQAVRSHIARKHPDSTFAVSRERRSRSREKSPAVDLKPVVELVDVLKLNPVEIQKIKRRHAVRRIDVDLS